MACLVATLLLTTLVNGLLTANIWPSQRTAAKRLVVPACVQALTSLQLLSFVPDRRAASFQLLLSVLPMWQLLNTCFRPAKSTLAGPQSTATQQAPLEQMQTSGIRLLQQRAVILELAVATGAVALSWCLTLYAVWHYLLFSVAVLVVVCETHQWLGTSAANDVKQCAVHDAQLLSYLVIISRAVQVMAAASDLPLLHQANALLALSALPLALCIRIWQQQQLQVWQQQTDVLHPRLLQTQQQDVAKQQDEQHGQDFQQQQASLEMAPVRQLQVRSEAPTDADSGRQLEVGDLYKIVEGLEELSPSPCSSIEQPLDLQSRLLRLLDARSSQPRSDRRSRQASCDSAALTSQTIDSATQTEPLAAHGQQAVEQWQTGRTYPAAVGVQQRDLSPEAAETVSHAQKVLAGLEEQASVLAHDMKNPLNGVLALTQNVMQGTFGDIPEAASDQLAVVRACAFHLLNMVNNMRDMLLLVAGSQPELQVQACHLVPTLEEVLKRMSPMVGNRLKIHNMVEGQLTVYADDQRLYQAIHSVVGNAFKYTRRGSVTFQARTTDDRLYTTLSIIDTGNGFTDDQMNKFNAPFASTEPPMSKLALGLSMTRILMTLFGGQLLLQNQEDGSKGAIVELVFRATSASPALSPWQATPAHGGSLATSAQKEVHKVSTGAPARDAMPAVNDFAMARGISGAAVSNHSQSDGTHSAAAATSVAASIAAGKAFTAQSGLPNAQASAATAATAKQLPSVAAIHSARSSGSHGEPRALSRASSGLQQHEGTSEGARILIVDDDPVNLSILESLIRPAHYDVLTAGSGSEALEIFVTCDPPIQLVLLDVTLPDLNGHEVCAKMRSLSPGMPPPIIMVSGKSSTKDVIKGLQAGACDYITKPFQPKEVLARIETQLRLYTGEVQQLQEMAERNMDLLAQLLPQHILRSLQGGKRVLVEKFPDAFVLCAEVVGFADLASQADTSECVLTLNRMFSSFDGLMDKHDVHKVDSLGERYIAAAGHVRDAGTSGGSAALLRLLECAKDMLYTVQSMQYPETLGGMQLAVGIHAGPVHAGVLGIKYPRYHLFGSTVRLAAWLCSTALPNTVHCSDAVASRLRPLGAESWIPYTTASMAGTGMIRTHLLALPSVNLAAIEPASIMERVAHSAENPGVKVHNVHLGGVGSLSTYPSGMHAKVPSSSTLSDMVLQHQQSGVVDKAALYQLTASNSHGPNWSISTSMHTDHAAVQGKPLNSATAHLPSSQADMLQLGRAGSVSAATRFGNPNTSEHSSMIGTAALHLPLHQYSNQHAPAPLPKHALSALSPATLAILSEHRTDSEGSFSARSELLGGMPASMSDLLLTTKADLPSSSRSSQNHAAWADVEEELLEQLGMDAAGGALNAASRIHAPPRKSRSLLSLHTLHKDAQSDAPNAARGHQSRASLLSAGSPMQQAQPRVSASGTGRLNFQATYPHHNSPLQLQQSGMGANASRLSMAASSPLPNVNHTSQRTSAPVDPVSRSQYGTLSAAVGAGYARLEQTRRDSLPDAVAMNSAANAASEVAQVAPLPAAGATAATIRVAAGALDARAIAPAATSLPTISAPAADPVDQPASNAYSHLHAPLSAVDSAAHSTAASALHTSPAHNILSTPVMPPASSALSHADAAATPTAPAHTAAGTHTPITASSSVAQLLSHLGLNHYTSVLEAQGLSLAQLAVMDEGSLKRAGLATQRSRDAVCTALRLLGLRD